ncbi:hypothetical protein [Amycolatopsis sp. H20-H5]|uniref:hypothetical protein n=1 Tax=Amycolatopsis sp. H20-H5 TaxID=3046309 RepID=UPI002DBE2A80|nr:hypothetical protein [Amycolatopsis sp. H20-H5]MEC3977430.1 hypothetical protein [Amycolatopsis sp. H20-H5]
MTIGILLLNLIVFAVAIESDIGRRKIGPFRVFRPLVTGLVIVPFFFEGMSFSGNGLLFEIGAALVGAALGFVALTPMKFEYDVSAHRVYSRAGLVYVGGWVLITGAKIFFSYGSTDIWGRQLFTWMTANDISIDAFRAAFIFLNVATMLARVGSIYFRGSATAKAAGASHHIFKKIKQTQSA